MTNNVSEDVLCLDKVQCTAINRASSASEIVKGENSLFTKIRVNPEKLQVFLKNLGTTKQDETTRIIYTIYVDPTGGIL